MNKEELLKKYVSEVRKPILLIVDDQPINIFALNALFEDDYEVLMATSGIDALAKAQDNSPDLIMLDINMPGMNGYDVCQKLIQDERTKHIPVIFVTGENDVEVEAKGFELGAVDFISKPFNPIVAKARVLTHTLLKLQMDSMKDMAMIDGLTGLYNRRKFDESLAMEWKLCKREARPLSLLMLDVDYFKKFNDRYGHQKGDDCLALVAQSIKDVLKRPADVGSRYGGEEFVCLLPFTDVDGARKVAEQIRTTIQSLSIEHGDSDVSDVVTISVGISCLVPDDDNHNALLSQADEALYVSKHKGRNCCSIFANAHDLS